MMHEGMDGKHDFAIHLKTNDPKNPDFLVHVIVRLGTIRITKSLRYQELAGEILSTNTANPLMDSDNERLKIFLHALLFVLGFSVVFIIGWGGSATLIGQFFGACKRIIAQIGGVIVILFGLATLGLIRWPGFYNS